jgi:DNA-binding IclR family transcriptional regulator
MTAVVGKLFKIVDCIAEIDQDSLSLATLTRETGLPKATLYRLLGDLVSLGILDHAPGGYSLGGKLFELGGNVPEYRRLRDAASPYLQELTAVSRESTHLATLRDNQVLYIERIPGYYPLQLPTAAGSRHPLHCSALGKTLLAHAPGLWDDILRNRLRPKTRHTIVLPRILLGQLTRVRDEGLATEFEEFRLGIGCVAAPIRNAEGAVVAAISISGEPRTKLTPGLHARVRHAAAQISRDYQRVLAMTAVA